MSGRPTLKLVGERFGRLVVQADTLERIHRTVVWLCLCDCGNLCKVRTDSLTKSRPTRSCGCLVKDSRYTTHGQAGSPEYKAFMNARGRCTNPDDANYTNYGGRGIEFRFGSFDEFFNHLGKRTSSKHSLDRIENNGHYEKGNVRWATMKVQSNNRRTKKEKS